MADETGAATDWLGDYATSMSRSLAGVEPGDRFEIREVPEGQVRAQLLRIGLLDGVVECTHHIRNGPVVIESDGTQIAIGASIAEEIEIDAV